MCVHESAKVKPTKKGEKRKINSYTNVIFLRGNSEKGKAEAN